MCQTLHFSYGHLSKYIFAKLLKHIRGAIFLVTKMQSGRLQLLAQWFEDLGAEVSDILLACSSWC